MPTTTTNEITYHEVVFGPNEADRALYPDYGDESFISRTADARATSKFLELVTARVRVGLFCNGVLVAGDEPIYPDEV